jgi:hypothetical protein
MPEIARSSCLHSHSSVYSKGVLNQILMALSITNSLLLYLRGECKGPVWESLLC